ncbi:MAG: DUF99 family protein [Deltaproteobacteria bacterium]|nr:DUF99 family protein [Deltaproteobacteria bacterium]
MIRPQARIVGIDDGPFEHRPRAPVLVAGVLMRGGGRVDGVVTTRVLRDGFGATRAVARMLSTGRLAGQAQAVLIDGVAVGGFNVIDLPRLAEELEVPVIAVMRRAPDLEAVRRAIQRTTQPERRWRMIQAAGAIERAGKMCFQVAGASTSDARQILEVATAGSEYPEALRLAHMIAGAIVTGTSRGRP